MVLQACLDREGRRITVFGDIDALGADPLIELTNVLTTHGRGDVTIDLAGVTFLDAAGLGVLVGIANTLCADSAQLILLGARPRVQRVFEVVGLALLLQVAR